MFFSLLNSLSTAALDNNAVLYLMNNLEIIGKLIKLSKVSSLHHKNFLKTSSAVQMWAWFDWLDVVKNQFFLRFFQPLFVLFL